MVTPGDPNGAVVVFDSNKNIVQDPGIVDMNPVGIAVNPNGQKVYVACQNGDNHKSVVSIINTDTYAVSSLLIPGGIDPNNGAERIVNDANGIAVSPQSDKVYVTKTTEGLVDIIDEKEHTIIYSKYPISNKWNRNIFKTLWPIYRSE